MAKFSLTKRTEDVNTLVRVNDYLFLGSHHTLCLRKGYRIATKRHAINMRIFQPFSKEFPRIRILMAKNSFYICEYLQEDFLTFLSIHFLSKEKLKWMNSCFYPQKLLSIVFRSEVSSRFAAWEIPRAKSHNIPPRSLQAKSDHPFFPLVSCDLFFFFFWKSNLDCLFFAINSVIRDFKVSGNIFLGKPQTCRFYSV